MLNRKRYQRVLELKGYKSGDKKKWLINNFELFKSTLNWPPGLPPINRTLNFEGTVMEEYNLLYKEILNQFKYELDNNTKTLTFFDD